MYLRVGLELGVIEEQPVLIAGVRDVVLRQLQDRQVLATVRRHPDVIARDITLRLSYVLWGFICQCSIVFIIYIVLLPHLNTITN